MAGHFILPPLIPRLLGDSHPKGGGGGQLQPCLMPPPPAVGQNLAEGGGGFGGGGGVGMSPWGGLAGGEGVLAIRSRFGSG